MTKLTPAEVRAIGYNVRYLRASRPDYLTTLEAIGAVWAGDRSGLRDRVSRVLAAVED